ncbi:MAG: SRPBCC family protein [Acidimicrobiia bacterium]|nr:SRPBCC family protein [Acidimicrobiia bacterium]
MARYSSSIRTALPPAEAFEYMADLRNFEHWDPGVRGVTQVDGDGADAGASFDVVVDAPRGGLTLRYETTHFDPPREAVIQARSRMFASIDRIKVVEDAESTVVTYDAILELNGLLRMFELVLRPVFNRIGDRANEGLIRALEGRPA